MSEEEFQPDCTEDAVTSKFGSVNLMSASKCDFLDISFPYTMKCISRYYMNVESTFVERNVESKFATLNSKNQQFLNTIAMTHRILHFFR